MTELRILPEHIIHMLTKSTPDMGDSEVERDFVMRYRSAHDSMLDLMTVRSVSEEKQLAYARATLMQRGIDESMLPWGIAASYELRLSEYLEQGLARKYVAR